MNPFVYPKTRHVRTEQPRQYTDYRSYKPYLQKEFERQCVYCRMPDPMRSPASFGVDHYRPKKHFPKLATAYSNLFYCCNQCNSRKGDYWPAGERDPKFIPNPCDHEMYRHLRYTAAMVESRSETGRFTLELLDLNDPDVVSFRETLIHLIEVSEAQKAELELILQKANSKRDLGDIPAATAAAAIREAERKLINVNNSLAHLTGKF